MKGRLPRLPSLAALLALALAGIATKFYSGPYETWVGNYAGGLVYEVFWILLFAAVFPKARAWRIVFSVFLVTCTLEFLQLYHPPVLEAIRATFIGRALIGNTFDPSDFIVYAGSSAIGWALCRAGALLRLRRPSPLPCATSSVIAPTQITGPARKPPSERETRSGGNSET